MFKASNQGNTTKNWNFGERWSYDNHKIIDTKKVESENHNATIRINT
jgi:hypothetical protein